MTNAAAPAQPRQAQYWDATRLEERSALHACVVLVTTATPAAWRRSRSAGELLDLCTGLARPIGGEVPKADPAA